MATDDRYVQVTLVLEESGILDADAVDSKHATRMYTLSDPSGVLDGEFQLICSEHELERELKNLNAIPVVARQVATTSSTARTTVSGQPSFPYTKLVGNSTSKKALFEAPANISAGSLVNKLAEETGTRGVWTTLLADLVDDLLRPQK